MRKFRLQKHQYEDILRVPFGGTWLMRHPMFNKGTAYTEEERKALDLEGLLPTSVATQDDQARRVYENLSNLLDPLQKYMALADLHERNEHLFYRVLNDNLEEFLPIVYTPTVGRACQNYSHIFQRARGLWITPDHGGRIKQILKNTRFPNVRLIVVTDNERILGLGDQGAGGMGIPIGKLALYSVAAGIHPSMTLPISLDVGTDNPDLLADSMYLGYRKPRLRGQAYQNFVDEFVEAVKATYPDVLLQWEDFKKANAFSLLDRYRYVLTSFNDDIQGTAAVVLAAMIAGLRLTHQALADQRVMILGAGAAGIGIARLLRTFLKRWGIDRKQIPRSIMLVDSQGLLGENRNAMDPFKRNFAWSTEVIEEMGLTQHGSDLEALVDIYKPTVLLGVSGQAGMFSERMVRIMAKHVARPLIFPLSNPNSKSEANPEDLIHWSDGRALIATGSPFGPLSYEGETRITAQANNVFVFPGVGLGALVSGATCIRDEMFYAAAETLSSLVTEDDLRQGLLLPPVTKLRRCARQIGIAVARVAGKSGLCIEIPEEQIAGRVDDFMWTPRYPKYVLMDQHSGRLSGPNSQDEVRH